MPVTLSLRDQVADDETTEFFQADLTTGDVTLNGVPVTDLEIEEANRRADLRREDVRRSRVARRTEILQKLANLEGWRVSGDTLKQLAESNGPIVVSMTVDQIHVFATQHVDLVEGLGLAFPDGGDDTLASALARTRTDLGIANGYKGTSAGVYQTEGGCPPAGFFSRLQVLDTTNTTNHARNVSSILRAASPNAFIVCRPSSTLPQAGDLSNPPPWAPGPPIRLINHSRSPSGNQTGQYDTFTRDWDQFIYDENVLIINSAGNTDDCPTEYVANPGRGLNLLTVGNYDDADDTIVSSSCWKDPTDTRNTKPEVVAPGQGLSPTGPDNLGNAMTCSGTSCATPHVSGIAANLVDALPLLKGRAALVKASVMVGAVDAVAGGVGKTGFGGVDLWSSLFNGQLTYWSGAQSSVGLNGNLEVSVPVPGPPFTRMRVVAIWLTRGAYTYQNRTATFPMGLDFDMRVYKPNGTLQDLAANSYSNFEVSDFTPVVQGTYVVRLTLVRAGDVSNNLRVGLAVSWE